MCLYFYSHFVLYLYRQGKGDSRDRGRFCSVFIHTNQRVHSLAFFFLFHQGENEISHFFLVLRWDAPARPAFGVSVAQNTNYSWLKGTKCFSMNNNLARFQPAKAGLCSWQRCSTRSVRRFLRDTEITWQHGEFYLFTFLTQGGDESCPAGS